MREQDDIFEALGALADQEMASDIALSEVINKLDDRAFGAALFLLALPCSVPFLVGVPQLMAAPILALTIQMALGRSKPWIPAGLVRKKLSKAQLKRASSFGVRAFGWIRKFAKPRFTVLFSHHGERVCGVVLSLIAAALFVPLPGSDSIPGASIVVSSLGITMRDGAVVVAGWALGAFWFVGWAFLFGAMAKIVIEFPWA